MALAVLSVRGFRNLVSQTINLAAGANFVFGPNGAGKTNLLEAIHYLAVGRSFRRCSEPDLIGFGGDMLLVAGRDDAGLEAEVRFDRREKRLLLGGRLLERLSDYFGWLPVVVLALDDIELVRGAPSLRRNFLDMAIAKLDRGYISLVTAYRRVLAQRNRLLQQSVRDELLRPWDEELVRTGLAMWQRRGKVVPELLAGVRRFGRDLLGHELTVEYRPSVEADRQAFEAELVRTRARSLAVGMTLVGPHRDEIAITRGGRDLRRFGSVGEQRLASIALRLAEAELIDRAGHRPIFLLDEVASELDSSRSALVLDLVSQRGQFVYVAARRLEPLGRGDTKEFSVEAGQITEV